MKIFEEYNRRNNIQIPLVHNCQAATALCFNYNDFLILDIELEKEKDNSQKFKYLIKTLKPNFNGFSKNPFEVVKHNIVKVNKYEDYLFNWVQELNPTFSAANSFLEKEIILWDMLSIIYNDEFYSYDKKICELISHSLNKDISYQMRSMIINDILSFLNPDLVRFWKIEMYSKYISVNSEWLEKLINYNR